MAKEKNGVLTEDEQLLDVALRSIGISLPDEYVLRVRFLMDRAKVVGLSAITLGDAVAIGKSASEAVRRRLEENDNNNTNI